MILAVYFFAALSPALPAILGLVAAIFGPLGAYLIARRQFSGQVETSDARALWEESAAIRRWSSERIRELEERNSSLAARSTSLEERVDHLEAENRELRERLGDTVSP